MTAAQRHAVHVRCVRCHAWTLALRILADGWTQAARLDLDGIAMSLVPGDQLPGGIGGPRS